MMENAADEYEKSFMTPDEGGILHRDKMKAPRFFQWLLLFCLIAGLIGTGTAVAAQGLALIWAPIVLLLGLAFVWLNFMALRVVVTPKTVYIQYGMLGPRIPIESITRCEADEYSIWKYGGYGIRYSLFDRSWAFNMLGDKGRAVRVQYTLPSGRERKIVLSSHQPKALADAINHARSLASDDVATDEEETVLYSEDQAVEESTVNAEVEVEQEA
jgi:hypothetical protein